ncbi:GGDEF domain-containing protein, partial [Umezakia ovalisporum]|uniref:GGDEF domain-containing protein n=1 Tax=Umezakia ovalisporum TaxID=75695 RepID=UPI0039C674EE
QGDKVLCMVAKALGEFVCGPDGLACRYGGEEFALLFKELSLSDAQMVADSLIDVIAALRIEHIDSLTGYVTISVGCAAFRSDEDTATWLRRCDEA